jgi:hypothetical protein
MIYKNMSGLGTFALIIISIFIVIMISITILGGKKPYLLTIAIRSLKGHFNMNMALLCATCVATTVITGSLIAGDSLKESIEVAAYENLQEVDEVVTTDGLFNESIVSRLKDNSELMDQVDHLAPLIYLKGSAEHPQTGARTQKANIIGFDPDFLDFGDRF